MKIFITGYNRSQEKNSNTKGVINFSNLLRPILLENGHQLVTNPDQSELCVVFVSTLKSLNTANALKAIDILKNYNSIIALDDWNIKVIYVGNLSIINGYRSKTHPHYSEKQIDDTIEVLQKINNGFFKVLYPAYKTGNHELLNIIGNKTFVDPSIYINIDYVTPLFGYNIQPCVATLANKDSFLKKLKYEYVLLDNIKEKQVFEKYCEHRIVINPPHYHDGSGWFRNRYSLANFAKAVIVEDKNSVFGKAYNISGLDVNIQNVDNYYELQNESYKNTIMDKNEISNNLKQII